MTDNTLTPTDAEIDAIADQHKASGHGTVWPHAFARAVLAKWGAPAAALPPELTSIAAVEVAAPSAPAHEPLTEEQMHKDLAALCKRIFNARIGKACSNCDGGTYQSDNNGYGQFHRCSKCRYVPMWGEDGREFGAPIAAAQKGGSQ